MAEKLEETSNSKAPEARTEELRYPLNEIESFDSQLLDDLKSGFEPLFVRNPTTTIYSVPKRIYNVKPNLYEDSYQYFGVDLDFDDFYPRSGLKGLHMLAHMKSILSRNQKNTFEDYIGAMNEMREEIRLCHLEEINVDFKCLIALVLSCCHILDVLLLFIEGRLTPQEDQLCSTGFKDLCMDMLLVQSQVPFFALQKIYNMLDLDPSVYPTLTELSLHFFKEFLEFDPQVEISDHTHHLLHLVHHHLHPSNKTPTPTRSKQLFLSKLKSLWLSHPHPELPTSVASHPRIEEPIPSARELQEAGIKSRRKKTNGFSNITFCKGVMEIPHLRVDNYTEVLLRNMIAWEQCHPQVGYYFTSYAIFMDFIINTGEDIEILNRSGIIEQKLGSEEQVASIFNGLSTNIVYIEDRNDFLPNVSRELNKYCKDKFNIWKANLMNDYFNNPWTIISVIAAIFILFLTATQTFFSVFAYFCPP